MSAPASAAAAASSSAMDDVPTAAAAAVAPSLSLTEEKESGAVDGDEDDDEEGTIVQEEFKIWKKNAPYLCQDTRARCTAHSSAMDEQRAALTAALLVCVCRRLRCVACSGVAVAVVSVAARSRADA